MTGDELIVQRSRKKIKRDIIHGEPGNRRNYSIRKTIQAQDKARKQNKEEHEKKMNNRYSIRRLQKTVEVSAQGVKSRKAAAATQKISKIRRERETEEDHHSAKQSTGAN